MATLNNDQKLQIIHLLAQFRSPLEVQAEFRKQGITLDASKISYYDPTNASSVDLAQKWRDEFKRVREQYLKEVDAVPGANKRYRLEVLQRRLEAQLLKDRPNDVLIQSLLEQMAKESGGAYTNRREISGPNGTPLKTEVAVTPLEDLKKLPADELVRMHRDALGALAETAE